VVRVLPLSCVVLRSAPWLRVLLPPRAVLKAEQPPVRRAAVKRPVVRMRLG